MTNADDSHLSSTSSQTGGTLPLIDRAGMFKDRIAITTANSTHTYGELAIAAQRIAGALLGDKMDLQEQRVAYLVTPGFEYVAVQWGIWLAGGVAVPLCISHPRPELEYVIQHSQASIVVSDRAHEYPLSALAHALQVVYWSISHCMTHPIKDLPPICPNRRALMLFTSGTTGKPKGVVSTHAIIQAQVTSLVTAWEWTSADRILHFLPLHHIHGVINVLTCALWSGAQCHILPKFDAHEVWRCLKKGDLTLLMGVPTIYIKLIRAWEELPDWEQKQVITRCSQMRLMVSGSAALPVQVLQTWQTITGQMLLERYGMTEIGMALSNPLHGERRAGRVGQPLPLVKVRLVDESGVVVPEGIPGEIQVQGETIFLEYWHDPHATSQAFQDGWFRTGDWAVLDDGYYQILGRFSADIIKTGGYKVSALEIEEVLRTHPGIDDCSVVGIPDCEWGERVGVAVILKPMAELSLSDLRQWCKERLAVYKVPTRLINVVEFPRNPMGKVIKPAVKPLFTDE